jgi:hypothetical protein
MRPTGALSADVDALIEPLRHAHGAAHVEAQLVGGVALQLAGDERRQRPALLLARLHGDSVHLAFSSAARTASIAFVGQRVGNELLFAVLVLAVGHARRLAVDADEARLEAFVGLLFRMQQSVQRPVLERLEGANLAFALHDQAHGHGLHAAGRKPAAHLVPQQRRNLIAHQAIQDAARLLRVHQILVDVARVLEGLLHGLLGDLVEGDAANLLSLFGVGSQLQRQMVRDRLAFAVRVRRQVDFVCLGGQLLQLVNHLLLARRHDQLRLKGPILQFHAKVVLRQVHDVPTDARTSNPLPRYFSIVFALAGDSTITSDLLVAIVFTLPDLPWFSLVGLRFCIFDSIRTPNVFRPTALALRMRYELEKAATKFAPYHGMADVCFHSPVSYLRTPGIPRIGSTQRSPFSWLSNPRCKPLTES